MLGTFAPRVTGEIARLFARPGRFAGRIFVFVSDMHMPSSAILLFSPLRPSSYVHHRGASYAVRTEGPPPKGGRNLASLKSIPIDYAAVEREAASIKRRYRSIFA